MQRPQITEIQVRIDCNGCVQKIKKALNGINGIYEVYIDLPKQKLTIVGWADPEKIIKAIKKTRKTATIYSHSEAQDPPPPGQPPQDVGAPPPEAGSQPGGPPPGESSQPPPPEPQKDQHPRPPPPLEPPRGQPQPQENPATQEPPPPSGDTNPPCHHQPKEVEEVHVIHHHPPDYGYGPRYGPGYSPGPPSYNPGPPGYNQPYGPGPGYSQGYGHDYSPRPSGYIQGYGHEYRPRPPAYSQGYGHFRDTPPGYSQQTGPTFGPEPPSYNQGAGPKRDPEPPGYSQGSGPSYGPEPPSYGQGYGENWSGHPSTGYRPERPQPVQVTHSYNQYRPPPYVTHYEHVPSPSPPQYAPYARTGSYYYDDSNRDYQGGSNGYDGSMFSEENPNACTIS